MPGYLNGAGSIGRKSYFRELSFTETLTQIVNNNGATLRNFWPLNDPVYNGTVGEVTDLQGNDNEGYERVGSDFDIQEEYPVGSGYSVYSTCTRVVRASNNDTNNQPFDTYPGPGVGSNSKASFGWWFKMGAKAYRSATGVGLFSFTYNPTNKHTKVSYNSVANTLLLEFYQYTAGTINGWDIRNYCDNTWHLWGLSEDSGHTTAGTTTLKLYVDGIFQGQGTRVTLNGGGMTQPHQDSNISAHNSALSSSNWSAAQEVIDRATTYGAHFFIQGHNLSADDWLSLSNG